MMNTTFAERCAISEQCLPTAPYRDMLSRLHADMLSEIEHLQKLADEWARLSQDEGKAERHIERLRGNASRWVAFRRIWLACDAAYDLFSNTLALAKTPADADDAIDAVIAASKWAKCDGGTCGVGGYCNRCKKAGGKAVTP